MTFNYELIRDFCGSFVNWGVETHNDQLLVVLPYAVDEFARKTADDFNGNIKLAKEEIIQFITCSNSSNEMVDYRTGIDTVEVMVKALEQNKKPTEKEIAAICDVIYVDNISVVLEVIADSMIAKLAVKEAKKKHG